MDPNAEAAEISDEEPEDEDEDWFLVSS
jgi:hypothetical protein